MVSVGYTTTEVIIKCGEPTWQEIIGFERVRRFREYPKPSGPGDLPAFGAFVEVQQKVEKWTYNCGKNRFIQILTFRGGILKKVENGNRGVGPYWTSDCVGARRRDNRDQLD